MNTEEEFTAVILEDLAQNSLNLPTLPEVAVKIRAAVEKPSITADQLARIISTDPVLSGRLLQIANSVFFKGLKLVDSVRTAIIRLGSVCVRNVVISLVVDQLYQTEDTSPIEKELHTLWRHSTRVASISHILAQQLTPLNPDEAMLAGLVHDIGSLPILRRALDFPEMLADRKALARVVMEMHPRVGKAILEQWSFPDQLCAVAEEHEDLQRNPGNTPDYTDIVLIANLHAYVGNTNNKFADINWGRIPAMKKLDLTPEQSLDIISEAQAGISEIQDILLAP